MTRHIYTLIVDCVEASEDVAGIVGKAANDVFSVTANQRRSVSLVTVVPTNGGRGQRPVLRMVEDGDG